MYTKKDIPRYLKKIAVAEKAMKDHPDWPQGLNELIIADAKESLRLCGYKPNAGLEPRGNRVGSEPLLGNEDQYGR